MSCDSLVLQGLRCEWGAGVLNLVLSLSLSHTGHWKFNMAPHGKVKSSHLYLYGAFNNTNCVKATAQYQNRNIFELNAFHY